MKKSIVGLMLLCTGSYALADDKVVDTRGWFVGGGVGSAMLTLTPRDSELMSMDEDASLYTVFGGYNFTSWFGLEFDIFRSDDFTDINTGDDSYILGTSFTPKFTYRFTHSLAVYMKLGLQYTAYEQGVDLSYTDDITWDDVSPLLGAGLQYDFPVGVNIRLDYKYSDVELDRGGSSLFDFNFFDDEIDLDFSTVNFTVNYQF